MTVPNHAVQVWVQGDTIFIHFPAPSESGKGHTSTTKANVRGWQIVEEILRERALTADSVAERGIGTKAAPTSHALEIAMRQWVKENGNPRLGPELRELADAIGDVEL